MNNYRQFSIIFALYVCTDVILSYSIVCIISIVIWYFELARLLNTAVDPSKCHWHSPPTTLMPATTVDRITCHFSKTYKRVRVKLGLVSVCF